MSKLTRFLKRKQLAFRKFLWRLSNNHSPNAKALYILGVQRSGTTMLTNCLEQSMEIEVYGENSAAMKDWRIRDDETIRGIITSSPCKIVAFKPLTDSHRAIELLKLTPDAAAIWMYRRFEDRANSAVARFGKHNQELLTAFSKGERLDSWQAMGMTPENLALLRTFDYEAMSPQSAAVVFWYLRNSLFFDQQLDQRDDVLPLAYEDLVTNPEPIMRMLCQFLSCQFQEAMVRDVHAKSLGRRPIELDSRVRDLCEPMYQRLHDAQQQRWRAFEPSNLSN
jgi:hypothetical protein